MAPTPAHADAALNGCDFGQRNAGNTALQQSIPVQSVTWHRVLLGLFAAAAVSACSQQATVVRPGGPTFDNAFTEPDLPTDVSAPRRRSPIAVGERAALAMVDEDASLDADHSEDDRRYRPATPLTIDNRMAQRCRQYRPNLERAGTRNGVDPLLLMALAWVESGFNPALESSAGARGLMQLQPPTANAMGCRDPDDVTCSAGAAAAYINYLLRKYQGDLMYALCAYNAGPVRPTRAWHRGELPSNIGFATRVLEARNRLERHGCAGQ